MENKFHFIPNYLSKVSLSTAVHSGSLGGGDMRLIWGHPGYISSKISDGPLECERQRVCPLIFQVLLHLHKCFS